MLRVVAAGAGPTDAVLVARVRAGSIDAFSSLYEKHAGAVATTVRSRISDPDAVADAVQEVFTRALERLDELRQPEKARAWLLAIARHAATDEQRRRYRFQEADDFDVAATSPANDPELTAELSDSMRLVRAGFAWLSPRDATALALVGELGLDVTEVAATLGVSYGAAKVILHRARGRLRQALMLELSVRTLDTTCGVLARLKAQHAVIAAISHTRTCPSCAEPIDSEVELYGADSSECTLTVPHPQT